jgi:hypothetical protein
VEKKMKCAMIVFGILVSAAAAADEIPPWWSLPDRGVNCTFKNRFQPVSPPTCGSKRYEVWSCVTAGATPFEPATTKDYLLVGEYGSDTRGQCSPTYFVTEVLADSAR